MNAQATAAPAHASGVAANAEMADSYATGFGLSFAITSVLSALLVVLKEVKEDSVLAAMKAITGHHWVTHGVLDVVLFVVIGLALAKGGQGVTMAADTLVKTIAGSVILSGLIIVGFYLLH